MLPEYEDFIEAYKITGIKPQCQIYYNVNENCGCPLTAMFLKFHKGYTFYTVSDKVLPWAKERYGLYFSSGIMDGFDSEDATNFETDNEEYNSALEIGIKLRKELLLCSPL